MGTTTRRAKTRKRRYLGPERRQEQQRKVKAEIDETIVSIVQEAIEQTLQDEVTQLLGRAKGERRNPHDVTLVEASCNRCGTRYRRSLYRAGY